jgi:hypothetical protein
MNKVFLIIFFSTISLKLFAQVPNGPGGVYTPNGATNLRGWYQANDLDGDGLTNDNPANGAAVSQWSDKSGYNNHILQGTASARPAYNTALAFPSVKFVFDNTTAANTDFMSFTNDQHFIPGSAFFVILPTDAAGLQSHILLDDAIASLRIEQYNNTNLFGYTVYTVEDYTTSLAPNYNGYTIFSWHKSDNNNNLILRQNNASETLDVETEDEGIPLRTLGKSSAIEGANYDAIEIITYNVLLSTMRIVIVENYLSSKYNDIPILLDLYTMDSPANGNHDHDVAGIGRISSVANSHTDARGSVVRMRGASSLSDGDYLFFGHNNGALSTQTTDLPTATPAIQGRWARTWGVTETNNPGTVNISFDMTNQGAVTATDLRLIIDSDNDGNFFEAVAGNTTIISNAALNAALGANVYEFSNVNLTTGTRFTLATINTSQTPLPVEILTFKGTLIDGNVHLNWETATEKNNDYFTIERSTDGETFQSVGMVKGAGNSSQINAYTSKDDSPPGGRVYYRLKQTDFDGEYSYSKIVSIENNGSFNLNYYPHPVKVGNTLNLKLQNHSLDVNLNGSTIILIDQLGREFQLPIVSESAQNVAINIPESFVPGVYLMKLQAPNMKPVPPYKVIITR